MTDTSMMARKRNGDRPASPPLIDEELADQLLGKAQAEGVELLGPDGLLSQVTKAVLERALAEEMTGHLGYEKHDPAGRGSGNSRNGTTPKTVLTDVGAVDLAVPRDRNGSFEPQIVRKGQTRLEGFNERIIALYARGMTTRDIRAHLREIYGVEVSPDLISRVTDGVVEELAEWQSRPLDAVYPVLFTGRVNGQDPRRGGHQPGGLPGDRHRLRREQAGPGPVDRAHDRRVGKVLAVGAERAAEPRRGRCVHRVLRRADRAARRDQRRVAPGSRAAVRGAPDPRLAAVCLPQVLGAHVPGPAPGLQRRRPAGRRRGARGVRRRLGRALPDDREAVAGALGRVHPLPGVPARGPPGDLHDEPDRVGQRPAAQGHPQPRPVPLRAGRPQGSLPGSAQPGGLPPPECGDPQFSMEASPASVHDLLRRTNPDPMKPPRSLTQTIGRSPAAQPGRAR